MASYEMVFLVDPRLPDEDVATLSGEYKEMLLEQGATVTHEESWGKRRLAYPINKLNEGRYMLYKITTEGENPFPEVERRMEQNDRVLRYLTVRLDKGRLRERPSRKKPEAAPGASPAGEPVQKGAEA